MGVKMLIKSENNNLIRSDYTLYREHQAKNEKSHFYQQEEEQDQEERELEIDLDYNEYVEVRIKEEDEPLDLSMKTLSKRCNDNPIDLQKPKLPRLDIRPNFKIFAFEQIEQSNLTPRQR